GAMFSCIGVLYDRMHTRRIADYGGVANVMPWFATFSMLVFMANAGLPGTSGFVGEFMVVLAGFQKHAVSAGLAATTLLTAAAYGRVANVTPWFATFSMLFFLATAGLPGTSGFVGEFMVVLASFQKHPVIAVLAATTLITAAAYTLWLYRRVFFGEVANAHVA